MLRNVHRIASSSLKNVVALSRLNNNNNNPTTGRQQVCLASDQRNYIVRQLRDNTFDDFRFLATYYYELVNEHYKNKSSFDELKDDLFFKHNYKETLKFLDKENEIEKKKNVVHKLSVLRSLQVIGVPAEDLLICKLIEDLSPNLGELTLDKTLKVLMNQVNFQKSKLQKFLIQSLVKQIENQVENINDLNTVMMIYNHKMTDHFSKEFLKQIDNKALELAKKMKENSLAEQEITFILHNLSLNKRRPKPLIQYLVNSLNEKELKNLEFSKVISLVDSLANLSYLSLDLMAKITKHLIDIGFITKVNKFDFNLLLKSFIKLRYDPNELFDYLGTDITLLNDLLGKKGVMNLVSTMAYFNYSKEKATAILRSELLTDIDIDLVKDSALRIEYLWSLAFYDALDKAPVDQFTLEFFTKILDKRHFYYLKQRFALLYHYCRLNLGMDVALPRKKIEQLPTIKEKSGLKTDDLLLVLKKENCLTEVETELGFKFDLVFQCNKDFETIPIKSIDEARQSKNEEYKLIYVYFLSLKEVALNTSKILGEVEMMKSIGKQMDYRIVVLNPYEMLNKPSLEAIKEFKQSCIDLVK